VLRDCLARGVSTRYLAALAHPRLGRALAAMHARLGERWTLDGLAREAGMSRSAFADAFREQVGRSPMRYLADWRMQEATRRLQRTRQSVERIAGDCGYASPTAFRKAFRALTGQTPRAVRDAAGRAAEATD
jgi:AraC family transcriptional regulator, activator of mtrCDE